MVERYEANYDGEPEPEEDGQFVLYSDYKELVERFERWNLSLTPEEAAALTVDVPLIGDPRIYGYYYAAERKIKAALKDIGVESRADFLGFDDD